MNKNLDLKPAKYEENKFSLEGLTINDRFVVDSKIGKGGFATVYGAKDREMKKYVVLKVINKGIMDTKYNPDQHKVLKRLIKSEGEIMKMIEHNHLLKCYDIYENDDFIIFITQFCNGGNLYDEIKKGLVLYEDDAINIIKQIVLGLAVHHPHIHSNYILKTSFIVISSLRIFLSTMVTTK